MAPKRSSKRAADSPDFANPKTRTFLFLNVSMMFIAFLLQFVHLLFYPFLDNLKSLKTAKEATPYKNDLFPFFHKKVAMILHHNDSISGVKIPVYSDLSKRLEDLVGNREISTRAR